MSYKGLLSPLGSGQAASCKETSHVSSKLVGRLQTIWEIIRHTSTSNSVPLLLLQKSSLS